MYEHLNKEVYLHLPELSMGLDILKWQEKYNNNNNDNNKSSNKNIKTFKGKLICRIFLYYYKN